ncbi:glycosyltransferase family 2 protein [Hyphomicrobium sp. CS1GBMeth3]|uniref:glycosyltransferase family 2 protein n=1 Tax=Hyphomicrobium sp. CS1GBMeth3 TaxID=1892845 RepID=UPI000930C358|nr:glycosyltransferase family 2 protein [Hyphomicrobium sp. CS1GBMeth3]
MVKQALDHPLVSVITPSFNSARFITDTLLSVQRQTLPDWEMIVVDDHSSDSSLEIVTAAAERDHRIRAVSLPSGRKGAAHARNFAMELARGRYIAFLDSDDLWVPEKLERQLAFMATTVSPFSYASYALMRRDGAIFRNRLPVPPRLTHRELLRTCPIGCLTVVYDTAALGKQYMPDLAKGQDYALWLQILRQVPEAHGLDEVLGIYRTGGTSLSSNKLEKARCIWSIYREIEGQSWPRATFHLLRYSTNYVMKQM